MIRVVLRYLEKFPGLQPISIVLLYLGSHIFYGLNKFLESLLRTELVFDSLVDYLVNSCLNKFLTPLPSIEVKI